MTHSIDRLGTHPKGGYSASTHKWRELMAGDEVSGNNVVEGDVNNRSDVGRSIPCRTRTSHPGRTGGVSPLGPLIVTCAQSVKCPC